MEYKSEYWVDKNNNKWNSNKFSKNQAIKLSATLINCSDCVDSCFLFNCIKCIRCTNCRICNDCIDCIWLDNSKSCINCKWSKWLNNCTHCIEGSYLHNCSDLFQCFDLDDFHEQPTQVSNLIEGLFVKVSFNNKKNFIKIREVFSGTFKEFKKTKPSKNILEFVIKALSINNKRSK